MVEQQKLQRLRQLITEGLRVQLGGERISYINVGHALEDASAKQNHTIFARRGCGKTLLLHASAAELGNDVRAIYLNCEDFKRHSFPNVLIVILHTLFSDLEANLTGWFGRKAQTRRLLAEITKKLKAMQHQPDEVDEAVKQTFGAEQGTGASLEVPVHAAKVGLNASRKEKSEVERAFKHHREKLRDLDHWLPELKKNLRTFFELSTNVRTILLQIDDLYHLKRADQAFVVDYIHRLCKDLPIFFKIATMRHASTLFADREGQPIGAQERHDFQPVNIDYTFSDFKRTSNLNWQILREYGRQADLDEKELKQLFKGEGFDRLVLAGGGVPRDVLSLFLEAMSAHDGEAVGKDEVRVLSKSNLERRIEELKKDSHADEQDLLIAGIYMLRSFCLSKKTNIFLVPEKMMQQQEEWKSLFNRLLDYRIIHQAGSALTHKSSPGNYQAFAIDIGCYAHFRKMENRFTEIDLSRVEAKDQMRSAPILTEQELGSLSSSVPQNAEQLLVQQPEEVE
ncbi:hypothetical protein [Bradyrhizobium barranii]